MNAAPITLTTPVDTARRATVDVEHSFVKPRTVQVQIHTAEGPYVLAMRQKEARQLAYKLLALAG